MHFEDEEPYVSSGWMRYHGHAGKQPKNALSGQNLVVHLHVTIEKRKLHFGSAVHASVSPGARRKTTLVHTQSVSKIYTLLTAESAEQPVKECMQEIRKNSRPLMLPECCWHAVRCVS